MRSLKAAAARKRIGGQAPCAVFFSSGGPVDVFKKTQKLAQAKIDNPSDVRRNEAKRARRIMKQKLRKEVSDDQS
jgi:hypothetical protein